jgi:surface carbohydrate biosynthesis protein
MKILICVPDKLRDLEGHALVAFHLTRRHGHDVRLVEPFSLESVFLQHAPDAIVLDYVGSHERLAVAQMANRFGVPVIMLPIAVFMNDTERDHRRADRVLRANRYVNGYLACGEEARQHVLQSQVLKEDQVHVVGCPRFDFYAHPYLRLMEDREVLLGRFGARSTQAPIILWTTNTYFAGFGRADVRSRVRYAGWSKKELEEEIEDNETQYREHSRAVLDLARRRPGWTFLVKVHPSESLDAYQSMPAAVPNLYVAKEVPVRSALYHADVILQRGCTTASESWMLGKPVVEMEIGRYHHSIRSDYKAGNEAVTDGNGLERAIERYLGGVPVPKELLDARESFIKMVYCDISGRSSERCADAIAAIVAAPHHSETALLDRRGRIEEEWRRHQETSDNRISNRIKDAVGLERDKSFRFWRRSVWESWLNPRSERAEIDAGQLYRRFEEAHGASNPRTGEREEAAR